MSKRLLGSHSPVLKNELLRSLPKLPLLLLLLLYFLLLGHFGEL